jgi:hypothetical protein
LGLTCRPGPRPPPAPQPDGGDLLRACRPDSSQCCPPGRRACHPPPGQGKETAITSIPHPEAPQLTIGVDTHLEVHVAHANDQLGRPLATLQIPTTPAGYQQLLGWAHALGEPVAWGVEGTGSYGAALVRFLTVNGQVVVEVNRPDRQARRRQGKSDPLDARAAAKAVQAGEVTVLPKAGDGQVEMIRCLRVARATAMRARTQTINALKGLLVTAPTELREQLRGRSVTRLVQAAAALEPGPLTSPLPRPPSPLAAWPAAIRPSRPRSTRSPANWSG